MSSGNTIVSIGATPSSVSARRTERPGSSRVKSSSPQPRGRDVFGEVGLRATPSPR